MKVPRGKMCLPGDGSGFIQQIKGKDKHGDLYREGAKKFPGSNRRVILFITEFFKCGRTVTN